MAQIVHVGSSSGEKRANVIFLHGLGGDPRTTWQRGQDDQSFWPRWLVDDIAGLDVFSVGYESPVSRWNGTAMHLTACAENVLSRILAKSQLQAGQLILVGHSLGGLVIKQFLRTAESKARYDAGAARFLERVEKVAFLATPHSGADLAGWGDRLRIAIRPSAATACLVRNDPNLRDLNLWYRDWANERDMSHLTLTETDAIRIVGMVVKPDSGDPGLANSRPISIRADHFTICKPVDREHDTYALVRNFIESKFERFRTTAEDKLEALPDAVVAKLMAALNERGETANAEKAGVSRDVIIQLAKRINADVVDFDQAMLELERAITVAVEVVEEGRRGSNTGDFIDAVLTRIGEKSAEGRFDEAAAEADSAFAQWEREEIERRDSAFAGGVKLLSAGLRQDILRRDPTSAAKRIDRIVALEHPDDRGTRFNAMRERQDEWHTSGRDKGLNFDLLVAIESARLLLTLASGMEETGAALVDLGVALTALGERDSDSKRLEEAVEVFRKALLEHTRERVPLEWAMTQNNLGAALRILGERETDTTRLEQAVETFRAALQEYTRERAPLKWAMTQNNLGTTLSRLGEREGGTTRLEHAVEAFRAALLEYTRECVPLDWAMTQSNLGNALRVLGEREASTARIEQAIEAYRTALFEYTRERVPLQWAMTQNNLGNALRALGEREADTAQFEQAVEAYRAALEEYSHERTPYLHDLTQENLTVALELLEQLKALHDPQGTPPYAR
jgi:tetratricopeptide (TPR) repeat protein